MSNTFIIIKKVVKNIIKNGQIGLKIILVVVTNYSYTHPKVSNN